MRGPNIPQAQTHKEGKTNEGRNKREKITGASYANFDATCVFTFLSTGALNVRANGFCKSTQIVYYFEEIFFQVVLLVHFSLKLLMISEKIMM